MAGAELIRPISVENHLTKTTAKSARLVSGRPIYEEK